MIGGKGFGICNVEGGADPVRIEGFKKGVRVHNRSASHVDEKSAVLHQGYFAGADEIARLGGEVGR